MSITRDSWQRLWQELGAGKADFGLMNQLLAAYSGSQRHYHTLQHLRECLAHFDAAGALARHPPHVELAIWFHDAVYDPQRHDNEARSADWAHAALRAAGCGEDVANHVRELVLATAHRPDAPLPEDPDLAVLLDIDLAILGAAPARFDEYERQVRAEYAHVAQEDFRAGRAALLRGFLARPRIYATDAYHAALDARARENLGRALG